MPSDQQQIRDLVHAWMSATADGDIERVLNLMTDDVVFLTPGRPPMDKAEFARLSRPQPGQAAPQVESNSEIQEIQIAGDWAYMWTRLTVRVVTTAGAPPIVRAGHTLSVLRKERGEWRLARDANLLTVQPAG